jgi:hypothetical protein
MMKTMSHNFLFSLKKYELQVSSTNRKCLSSLLSFTIKVKMFTTEQYNKKQLYCKCQLLSFVTEYPQMIMPISNFIISFMPFQYETA